MIGFVGQFIVVSYEDGEEIDRCGPFSIYSAAMKYAIKQSMLLGMTCRVHTGDIIHPSGEWETMEVFRRGKKLATKDYL